MSIFACGSFFVVNVFLKLEKFIFYIFDVNFGTEPKGTLSVPEFQNTPNLMTADYGF